MCSVTKLYSDILQTSRETPEIDALFPKSTSLTWNFLQNGFITNVLLWFFYNHLKINTFWTPEKGWFYSYFSRLTKLITVIFLLPMPSRIDWSTIIVVEVMVRSKMEQFLQPKSLKQRILWMLYCSTNDSSNIQTAAS